VITFLKLEYGMSEMFLEARSPSWIAWLAAQRRANSAPHDAMLVDSFEPNADDGIFAPHVLAAPLLPIVQRHDQVYGQPRAGGSGLEDRCLQNDRELLGQLICLDQLKLKT
jgi:hypothetical protein